MWWEWQLEFTPHLLKRMVDRSFSETDVRSMIAGAVGLREGDEYGRWVVQATHESACWEVIVEPDAADQLLVVITAYAVDST